MRRECSKKKKEQDERESQSRLLWLRLPRISLLQVKIKWLFSENIHGNLCEVAENYTEDISEINKKIELENKLNKKDTKKDSKKTKMSFL